MRYLAITAFAIASIFAGQTMAQYEINEAGIVDTVRTLTSDQFEGRAPGSVGEDRTSKLLSRRL